MAGSKMFFFKAVATKVAFRFPSAFSFLQCMSNVEVEWKWSVELSRHHFSVLVGAVSTGGPGDLCLAHAGSAESVSFGPRRPLSVSG